MNFTRCKLNTFDSLIKDDDSSFRPSKYIGIAPSSTIESDNSRYVSTSSHRLIRPPPRRLYEGDKIDEIYLRKLNEVFFPNF